MSRLISQGCNWSKPMPFLQSSIGLIRHIIFYHEMKPSLSTGNRERTLRAFFSLESNIMKNVILARAIAAVAPGFRSFTSPLMPQGNGAPPLAES
jgi:hypothetical protein